MQHHVPVFSTPLLSFNDGAYLISQERGLLERGSANQEVLWSPIGPADDSYLTTNWG